MSALQGAEHVPMPDDNDVLSDDEQDHAKPAAPRRLPSRLRSPSGRWSSSSSSLLPDGPDPRDEDEDDHAAHSPPPRLKHRAYSRSKLAQRADLKLQAVAAFKGAFSASASPQSSHLQDHVPRAGDPDDSQAAEHVPMPDDHDVLSDDEQDHAKPAAPRRLPSRLRSPSGRWSSSSSSLLPDGPDLRDEDEDDHAARSPPPRLKHRACSRHMMAQRTKLQAVAAFNAVRPSAVRADVSQHRSHLSAESSPHRMASAPAVPTHLAASADLDWRTYLRSHSASIERNLSDAANAVMLVRPSDPLAALADELRQRAPGGRRVHHHQHQYSSVATGMQQRTTPWAEEDARCELEEALEAALDAALDVLPHEPLGWMATYVGQLSRSQGRAPA